MNCTIKINMDNAAFERSPRRELSRILRELATRLSARCDEVSIYDINGNRVGVLRIERDDQNGGDA